MNFDQLGEFLRDKEHKITEVRMVTFFESPSRIDEDFIVESIEFMMDGHKHLYVLQKDGTYERMTRFPSLGE